MNKLYQLKNWYSLEDAAKRLTITLGEDISVNDILQMTVEGHLPLSWYMRHVAARAIAPYTKVCNWDAQFNRMAEIFGTKKEYKPDVLEVMPCLQPLSDEVQYLDGAHRLDLEMCGAMKDWVLSLITNTGGELISLDGYFVTDSEGGLWQIMERFTKEEQEAQLKAIKFPPPTPPGYRKPINHSSYFYPSGGSPDQADLGVTKSDLEAFEVLLTRAALPQNDADKPIKTTERNTLLKLVIGMAVAGYRYNPRAAKNNAVSEIRTDLENLGIAVSDDTIRKWLNEAAELLPQEVEKA